MTQTKAATRPSPGAWGRAATVRRRWSPLLSCLVLVLLAQQVLTTGPLTRLDRSVESALVPHRAGAGVHLARALTWLGNAELVVPVLLVLAAAIAVRHRRGRALAVVGVVLVGLAVSVLVIKGVVARPAAHGGTTHGGAWPSGHTTTATVVWGLAGRLLTLRGAVRTLVQVVVPVVVGVCLVLAGFHQVTDVVAGWALGAVLLAIADRLLRARSEIPPVHPGRGGCRAASPSR